LHLPEVQQLIDEGLARATGEQILLMPSGLECSDAIGLWLTSATMCRLMQEYELHWS
jgi:hypothetical protein